MIKWLLVLFLGLYAVVAVAQNTEILRIKESPLVRFDFDCTEKALYPSTKKLQRAVSKLLKQDQNTNKWGDRAFAFDLNGDNVKEIFVPLGCGGTGNCNWAIFRLNPVTYLGGFFGETIYIHKRTGKWSRLTLAIHDSAMWNWLETYHYQKNSYKEFGKVFLATAEKKNYPASLLKIKQVCGLYLDKKTK